MKDEKFTDIVKAGLQRLDYVVVKEKDNVLVISKDGDLVVELNTENKQRNILNRELYEMESSTISKALIDLQYVYKVYCDESNNLSVNGSKYHKKLCEFNDTVLAVGLYTDNVFEYAIWSVDRQNDSYYNGKYFMDYDMAKESFAIKSDILNRNRYFTDYQLKIVGDTLKEFVNSEAAEDLTNIQLVEISEVVNQIDELIPKSTSTYENVEETQTESESFGMEM